MHPLHRGGCAEVWVFICAVGRFKNPKVMFIWITLVLVSTASSLNSNLFDQSFALPLTAFRQFASLQCYPGWPAVNYIFGVLPLSMLSISTQLKSLAFCHPFVSELNWDVHCCAMQKHSNHTETYPKNENQIPNKYQNSQEFCRQVLLHGAFKCILN